MPIINLSHDQNFSLDQTLRCGQVFRWDLTDDGWWYGIVGGQVIKIRQDGKRLTFKGASVPVITTYFSLDTDLQCILESVNRDSVIDAAIRQCRGLRLIRQPKWECLISYIVSTNSNIPMIRRRINTIAEQFGREIMFEGRKYHAFPEPSAISCSDGKALADCRLGYRMPYVFNTACAVGEMKQWEKAITSMSFEAARRELMKLSGVGPKAADCILLFAFQKYEAFPVDVWIRRIMKQHYIRNLDTSAGLSGREYNMIRQFARRHFGKYCGYAQEYLYAARLGNEKIP